MSTNRHSHCPVTGSTDILPMKGYERHHLVKSRPGGFVFSEVIPSSEELQSHYAGYDREKEISPLTYNRYRTLLKEFEPYRKSNRIFDIGCGMGDFLYVAKQEGWEVYGNEFTTDAVEACKRKGIQIFQGAPDFDWLSSGQMDVVTSFEVIEHLSFPREHVQFAHHLLQPDGLFYCTTPNFNSIERYLLGAEYNVIDFPEHLSYFSSKTLSLLMKSEGFTATKVMSTGVSPARIKNSMKRQRAQKGMSSTPSPVNDDGLRDTLEGNSILLILKNMLNGMLDITKTGNALKGYFVKH